MWKEYICSNKCENYLDSLFNSMCEGFALHEIICSDGVPIDYKFLEVNTSFANITGLSKDLVIGKTVKEVYPDIEHFWIETYGKVALGGESIVFVSHFKELDSYFKVSAFSPLKGQFVTFFTDITELKKASLSLQKHYALMENAHDIILYTDSNGNIKDANRSAINSYGYSYEELINMSIQNIRHPSTAEHLQDQLDTSDLSGVVFESVHVRKNGTSFPVEVSARSTLIDNSRLRIHIIRDITQRKLSEEKISYLANYDSLTAVPNRSYLMKFLDEAIQSSRKEGLKFALSLFDIDKFKKINDLYGHNIGDIVLKETAKRVQNCIGKYDLIARLGGDEFVVVLKNINTNEDLSDRFNCIIEQFKAPIIEDNIELYTSISAGIAIYPNDSTEIDSLLNLADKAMYISKQNGGNSFRLYSLEND